MSHFDWDKLKSKGGTLLGRLAFETYIEFNYDQIIADFQEWLSPITTDRIREMVLKGEFPELSPAIYAELNGWTEYINRISAERLWQAIIDARRDLAIAMAETGKASEYIVALRAYFLKMIAQPERAVGDSRSYAEAPTVKIVQACCKACNKTWPVKETEFARIASCPFCHEPA